MNLSRRVKPRASRIALFYTRHEVADHFRERDLVRIWDAEARAEIGGGFDGGNDFRMRVSKNRRPPGADVIKQLIAVHVPDARPARAVHKKRLAAHRAKRAHRRVHAAGNIFQRRRKQFFRLCPCHTANLTSGRAVKSSNAMMAGGRAKGAKYAKVKTFFFATLAFFARQFFPAFHRQVKLAVTLAGQSRHPFRAAR
jgi:hypothetical protein